MKILNPLAHGDFHLHSSTLSDGLNTIDEITIQAGLKGYKKIAVTDHNSYYMECCGFSKKTHYSIIHSNRWQNIHNDVEVLFGVEADLINEQGDVCREIQGFTPKFVILSAHNKVWTGNKGLLKQGYLKAIQRYGRLIQCIGHLCAASFASVLSPQDIADITRAANRQGIALELNCANLRNGKTQIKNLEAMLSCCENLFVNSDSHTLFEFITLREVGFEYLKKNGYTRRIS